MILTEEDVARLTAEGWECFKDYDGWNLWLEKYPHSAETIVITPLEIWKWVGPGNGNRSRNNCYKLIAGPFDSLEAAQAAYLMIVDSEPN